MTREAALTDWDDGDIATFAHLVTGSTRARGGCQRPPDDQFQAVGADRRPGGFYLNGERMQIFGLNRHQLFPYTGMAMAARLQRRDAEILKHDRNMVRCAHYPPSPHFLDACDELGLMVWEESPGWQYVGGAAWQEQAVRDVAGMVTRDRSRPSVIVWGTRLNETADHPGLYARDSAHRRRA